jgi:hypothetical protein
MIERRGRKKSRMVRRSATSSEAIGGMFQSKRPGSVVAGVGSEVLSPDRGQRHSRWALADLQVVLFQLFATDATFAGRVALDGRLPVLESRPDVRRSMGS